MLLLSFLSNAQEQREKLLGRVVTGLYPVRGVLVVNISAQREVRSDSLGFFNLPVKAGDSIAVRDSKIIPKDFLLTENDMVQSPFIIETESTAYELEEVVINEYAHINSVSLGIIPHDIKLPTVAERRLKAGSSDPLGSLINVLSGRNKMLKRDVETEKKIMALEKLDLLFEDSFFIDELKIAKDLVKSFKYYVIEDKKLREMLNLDEEGLVKFKLAALAKEYLNIAKSEN